MNKKHVLFILCTVITSAILLGVLTYAQMAQKQQDGSAATQKLTYKNYIWIEGENAVSTNFAREPIYNFFCSNKFALQLSKDVNPPQEGYFANYVFYVTHTKEYDLWMGCTPPGSVYSERPGYASPIEWKIDSGPFQTASAENVYVKSFYGIGGFYWVKIATGTLNAGKHTLTIRVKQKRSSGWDYYFYLDAIMLLPHYSADIAELINFPEIAPKDFLTPGDGILFYEPEFYEKKLRNNINDRDALFNLVQIYGWLYDYNKAIFLLQKYLEKNPRDIQMRLMLAANYSWSDQVDAAINEYRNIISIDENNILARKLLSVLAGWNNRYDEAIKYYQEIIAIDPQNVDGYISLATQYSWKGEINKAIATFEMAESIAPNNIEVLEVLGDNYYWAGRTYDAIRQYYRIIDIDEKQIQVYKKLAKIYLDLGENAKAARIINDAKLVVDVYPELSGISLDIKDELAKERKQLIDDYKEALMTHPGDINIRKGLIDTYIWNRMYSDAVNEYDALLAYKASHAIEQAEQKINRLAIHSVGLFAIKDVLETINHKTDTIKKRYSNIIADYKSGKNVVFDQNLLKSDIALLNGYITKLNEIQKELLFYNDITAAFGKDVQTYTALQEATNWQFNPDRIRKYANTAIKLNAHTYHPYKVMGTVDLLFGSTTNAVSEFEKVKQLSQGSEFPGLALAYSWTNNSKKAIAQLESSRDYKNIYSIYKNDIDKVLLLATQLPDSEGSSASLDDMVKVITTLTSLLESVTNELDQKTGYGITTIRLLFEKQFLDLEVDNARIYKEMANYYLQNGSYNNAREYYNNILLVQPLNVEANLAMGNINEFLGYWQDAKKNYEVCINAKPDFEFARKAHYDLQKNYAPSITGTVNYFSDKIEQNKRSRLNVGVQGTYNPFQWLMLQAGYGYTTVKADGFTSMTPQVSPDVQYQVDPTSLMYEKLGIRLPSTTVINGKVTIHKAFVEGTIPIQKVYTKLFAGISGNLYSGSVDYKNNSSFEQYQSDINYYSLNYTAGILWIPPSTGISLRLAYSHLDENEMPYSLKLEFKNKQTNETLKNSAITYNEYAAYLDINFSEYDFPLSKRLFLYNSLQYQQLSDSNTQMHSYNQLTFRVYRNQTYNIILDIAGKYMYDDTKFNKYSQQKGMYSYVPYWAPQGVSYYGPAVKLSQQIDGKNGSLLYSIFFEYQLNSLDQKTMIPGLNISYSWDKLQLFGEYIYSNVKVQNQGSYVSNDIRFGATGKFFTIYTPAGAGGQPILFISVNPTLITPDGDGKDDFATLSLTAFDEKGISQWWIDILNEKGEKIQEYSLTGAVPATFKWDGTARNNVLAPEGKYYIQLTIQNSAGEKFSSKKQEVILSTSKRAVALTPSYKNFSPNGDKIKDTVSFIIQATDKKNVSQWFVVISSNNRVVKTIRGNDFIPYDVIWDGNDDTLKVVPDGEYSAVITIKYDDGVTVKSPATTVNVVTKIAVDIRVEPNEIIPLQSILRITPAVKGNVEQWQVRFTRTDGAVIKVINGAGTPPKVISWDGTDDKGEPTVYNMQLEAQMEITDDAGNTAVSNKMPFVAGFLIKQEKEKRILYMFNQDSIFKGRSSELTANGIYILDQLAGKLAKLGGFTKINIVAYTDSTGSKQSNIALSQQQATVIADRLKNLPAEIKTIGAGSETLFLKDKPSKWDMRYEIELY